MRFKYDKIIVMFLILLFFLVIIPSGFAADNQTENDASITQMSENGDVILGKDYYFDANAEDNTGDGSHSNPYKTLTDSRIKNDSTIHLANGEYSLKQKHTYSNISFYGEDAEKTVINGNGESLVVDDIFNLRDVTLNNFSIINNGDLKASNTIFSNSVSSKVDSTYDTFGSSISTIGKNHQVIIKNCTFINNYAQYGGAIYQRGGNLEISDSAFINSTALNYGGAIFCDAYNSKKAKVKITNSKFINSTSLNDAGGAIYLISSYLDVDNVSISYSRATFGGALTLLSSYSKLYNMKLNNNKATYNGGAIYHMYGNLTVINSVFINNSAKNVGALYMDTSDFFSIQNNLFINNSASNHVGAFYSLLNDYGYLKNNTYINNSALLYNDSLETLNVNPFISNGNYTMYMYNPTFDGLFPSYYNSFDEGYVTSVKSQGDGGNCWAFSILSTLESCIIKASGKHIELSVENMKNLMELYSDYGWNMKTNEGGFDGMGMGYLTGWLGPIYAYDDIYDETSELSPLLDSIMHVQNILYIKRNSFTDNYAIKKAIIDYGAVNTAIYMDATYYPQIDTFAQYCSNDISCDHSVSLVGWDDSIWIPGAPNPGAWIAKNSWGSEWGNDGYFYVSYYDKTCAKVGENVGVFTFILNDTVRYDKNYQYDIPGCTDYFLNTTSTVWYKNIFNATDNEYLAAVSTYFEKETNWNLSVYVNGALKMTKSGHAQGGYYTIDLGEFIPLKVGDIFEVIFKINVKGHAGVPISEIISLNKYFYKEGISFISYNGKKWQDLYELEWEYPDHSYSSEVACIKAFTIFDEIGTALDLNFSYNGFNPVEITASVLNQYGYPVNCGHVVFNLSGETRTADVVNGVAKITHDFKRGMNTISATFNACGYSSSSDSTYLNVIKYDVDMDLIVRTSLNTATVNVTFSNPINETVILTLNGEKRYTVKSVKGFASFMLSDLDYGLNEIVVSLYSPLYEANDITSNFTIDVKKTNIAANNLITVYRSGEYLNITLADKYGDDLSQKSLKITLNGETYYLTTKEKGAASMPISLSCGTYNMDIGFMGSENYLPSQKTLKISVKTSITFTSSTYTYYSKYSVLLLNKLGNPLANRYVKIIINRVTYDVKTNSQGYALVYIKLNPGTYAVKVTNPETGEVKSQNIKVASRISQNKDMSVYYGSGSCYKVKVLNDYAKLEKGLKVTFTINGKTYTAATDKNGIASFKINLNPKTYRITASYNGFKVTNTIKVKPTIVTKDVSAKKSRTFKFNAKLLNSKGQILKYKIVTFKVAAKTYKVKTNIYGVASLSLSNLKVGKHSIITSYGTAKVQNKIIIKK